VHHDRGDAETAEDFALELVSGRVSFVCESPSNPDPGAPLQSYGAQPMPDAIVALPQSVFGAAQAGCALSAARARRICSNIPAHRRCSVAFCAPDPIRT
jgi:hypothetical protein